MADTKSIIAGHDKYMTINYPRYPIAMQRGDGCLLWDTDDKQYLDLFSGFGAGILGHCHPAQVAAVTKQAGKLWHVGNLLHTEPQAKLAQAISEHGFGGRSYFCHSGADANEAAFKLARLHGQANPGPAGARYKVIATSQSFHGRSFATMAATGQEKVRKGFEPLLAGFSHVPYNDIEAIKASIDDQTVAVIVEPIQGEGGVNVPDDDYLPNLRALCDEHNMLLICDEVWTGCGRTGKYFAHQHWDIEPDAMTLAKGVGGGLAVAVMCAHPKVAHLFDFETHKSVVHATTLGGNCLSMAVAAAIFDVLEEDNLVEAATTLGEHAAQRMRDFGSKTGIVKEVRGKGLFIGIDLDCESTGTWFDNVGQVANALLDQGYLINGTQNTVLRLAPPLIVTQAQLDEGLDAIEAVLRKKPE